MEEEKCICNNVPDNFYPGNDGDCDYPLCQNCGAKCSYCNTQYCNGSNCHTLKHCEHDDCDHKACGDLIEDGGVDQQCGIYYIDRIEQFICHLHRYLYQ